MQREVVGRAKKRAPLKALFPTENTDQLSLVLVRLERAVAGVLCIVDSQPAVGIGIERPGVKALQLLVAQREGRAAEGPRSAAHELVSLPTLTRRRDRIVVGLDKRAVVLQHQGAIRNDESAAIGSLGEIRISRINRERRWHGLASVDGQLVRARRILQRVEDSVVSARSEQQWSRR
jgi:hypothetical protein